MTPGRERLFEEREVVAAAGGRLLHSASPAITGVAVDSRKVTPGGLFVALAVILCQGIENQRIFHAFGHLNFFNLALLQQRDLVAYLGARLYDNLTAFGIDDIASNPHIRRKFALLDLFGLIELPDYLLGIAEIGA